MLNISTGNSRTAKSWKNITISFDDLCTRLATPIRTAESVEEYEKLSKADRELAKDHGGFVAGVLKDGRRRIDCVESRSMLVYDIDRATDVDLILQKLTQYKGFIYSTHSHTPRTPRLRVGLVYSHDVDAETNNAISRLLAQELNIMEEIDPCSFRANQLMFWPSCPSDGEYVFHILPGAELDPDMFLSHYPTWTDPCTLPTTPGEKQPHKGGKKIKDPLLKEGIVGAWCRTHSIRDVLDNILSDTYERVGDRYRYRESSSGPGVAIYDDRFFYSNHARDPLFGRVLNAYDLTRLTLFGDGTDEKDSNKEMIEYASKDPAVQENLLLERRRKARAAFEPLPHQGTQSTPGTQSTQGTQGTQSPQEKAEELDWTRQFKIVARTGALENCIYNLRLIMENDPSLRNIVFNELADNIEVIGPVPWSRPKAGFWRDADDNQLICYIDANYGTFSKSTYETVVSKVTDDRRYHPIKRYLENLPPWDGTPRVETIYIDYLGAEDTPYTRAVTRKLLCGAVKRLYDPGCKLDYMTVLNGPQGIGKSTVVAKLGMGWFSDSLSVSDMQDKTAAEKLQGYWIVEIGEMAGMKKAEIEKVKAFASRQDDKYRAAFGHRVTSHPRQTIFIGTTNAENGYLRDITGNRRFWNVKVKGGKIPFSELTQSVVDQIWAEVLTYYADEDLFLNEELEKEAQRQQQGAMEADDREGLVQKFLDTPLPTNWKTMDLDARRAFLYDDDPERPEGVVTRDEVCNIEIWTECFGRNKVDIKPQDSFAIAAIMARLPEWERTDERRVLPIYGRQRVYRRKVDIEGILS